MENEFFFFYRLYHVKRISFSQNINMLYSNAVSITDCLAYYIPDFAELYDRSFE